MAERRLLSFSTLDEIMPEVERLLAGYARAGQWSLGQMCRHLATAMHYSTSSTAPLPEPTPQQAVIHKRFFGLERFPDGRSAPPGTELPGDLDDHAEVEKLRAAIAKFSSHTGQGAMHPLIGPLSHEDWGRFHCLHAAHHLGFVVPT